LLAIDLLSLSIITLIIIMPLSIIIITIITSPSSIYLLPSQQLPSFSFIHSFMYRQAYLDCSGRSTQWTRCARGRTSCRLGRVLSARDSTQESRGHRCWYVFLCFSLSLSLCVCLCECVCVCVCMYVCMFLRVYHIKKVA